MIGIIDYGMGNLRSVQKAFEHEGAAATILTRSDEVMAVDRLILPGVGAFADGMENLRQRSWIEPIRGFLATGRPFLGICLGLQLLFDGSQEDAASPDQPVPGLAILPGQVIRFHEATGAPDRPRIKVPHMGWNTIAWQRDDPLFAGLAQGSAVYFVHSYYAQPDASATQTITSAVAEYPQAEPFCASVQRDNIWATQFHPEKSQAVGLKMLANFARL